MDPVWPLSATSRRLLFRIFFFSVFVFLIYQLLRLLSPFLAVLAVAATVVLLFSPVHVRVLRLVGGRSSIAAALSTALVIVLVVLPFLLLGWLLVHQAVAMLPMAETWAAEIQRPGEPRLESLLPDAVMRVVHDADALMGKWGIDVRDMLARGLDAVGSAGASLGRAALANLLGIALNVLVVLLAVFFFLRDGGRMVRQVVDLLPMESVHKELVVRRLDETFGAVIRGSIVSAMTQGTLAGIGFAVAGLDLSIVLGAATCLFAFIPFVGAAGIWVPATLWLFASGATWQPWFLLLWGLLVVSLVDNVLKPFLIGDRAKIPTFLLFLGILGGLRVYGVLGVFIGPIVLGLLTTFVSIYRDQYQGATTEPRAEPAEASPGDPATPM